MGGSAKKRRLLLGGSLYSEQSMVEAEQSGEGLPSHRDRDASTTREVRVDAPSFRFRDLNLAWSPDRVGAREKIDRNFDLQIFFSEHWATSIHVRKPSLSDTNNVIGHDLCIPEDGIYPVRHLSTGRCFPRKPQFGMAPSLAPHGRTGIGEAWLPRPTSNRRGNIARISYGGRLGWQSHPCC